MSDNEMKLDAARQFNRNMALLHPGALVTLDITTPAGQRGKFRSTFIGYLPKQYILVQYPESSKLGSFAQYLTQGMSVTVRGLVEGYQGAVLGFISTVKQTIQIPSRIIVLDFPRDVGLQKLRSSMRIEADIKTKIKIGEEYWSAVISDISISGCKLIVNNGEELKLSAGKPLEIIIEDFQNLSDLKLHAEICNNKLHIEGISLGVEFNDTNKPEVKKLLQETITLTN